MTSSSVPSAAPNGASTANGAPAATKDELLWTMLTSASHLSVGSSSRDDHDDSHSITSSSSRNSSKSSSSSRSHTSSRSTASSRSNASSTRNQVQRRILDVGGNVDGDSSYGGGTDVTVDDSLDLIGLRIANDCQ